MNTSVRPDYVDAYLTSPSGMKSAKQTAVPLVAIWSSSQNVKMPNFAIKLANVSSGIKKEFSNLFGNTL